MSQPTWAVLDINDLVPWEDAHRMLGVMVVDMWHPMHQPTPYSKEPLQNLDGFRIKPYEEVNASRVVNSTSNYAIQVKLGMILDVKLGASAQQNSTIRSKVVTTYVLENHPAVLATLMADSVYNERIINALRNRVDKKLYMVVGIKTAKDAEISRTKGNVQQLTVEGTVPSDAVITSAVGVPAQGFDIKIENSVNLSGETTASGTAKGEMAFAFQYCVVRLKQSKQYAKRGKVSWDKRLNEQAKLEGLQRFKPAQHAMGHSEDGGVEGEEQVEISSEPIEGLDL